jgi:hypothetical protein
MSFSYARGEFSSFVPAARGPYIRCMKNRYPSPEELYALEIQARRLRSAEVARLLRSAVAALGNLFSAKGVKGLRHA